MVDGPFPDERCRAILEYYFGEAAKADCSADALVARTKFWFFRNPDTDAIIRDRFSADVERAARGELDSWADSPAGSLALVVLLDQFPRNIHRGSARAFEHDAKSLAIAEAGLEKRFHERMTGGERLVYYLPLMHAEDVTIQRRASDLYKELAATAPEVLRPELTNASKFADRHREIVERFGRFPHRNAVVGRESTAEEVAFLKEPNSSF